MNRHLLLALAITLGASQAGAQSIRVTTQPVRVSASVNVDVNLGFPVVQASPAVVSGFITTGTTVVFLNAGGSVVASVAPSGAFIPTVRYNPATVVNVRVVTVEPGGFVVRETYPLARPLPRRVRVETIVVRGGGGRVSLVSVMKRQHDKIKLKKAGKHGGKGKHGKGH